MTGLNIRGRIKHLLHTRPSLRTFVCNHDYIAAHHLTRKDAFTSRLLRIEHFGGTCKPPYTLINSGSFHRTSILRNVSFQYSQSAILAVSMGYISDTSVSTIRIQLVVISVL